MAQSARARQKPLQILAASPRKFVESAYPWGEGLLTGETGPDTWQSQVLQDIEAGLQDPTQPIRIAVSSGHGIGKGALSAWLLQWFMSTRVNPQIVVTANTKSQLDTKSWREVAKWHRLLKTHDWFTWQATKYFHNEYPDTWYASAIPWSAERPEAFAGTHEEHVMVIFDEASAIDEIIWDTTEGAMTTPGAIWVVLGNPTRTVGRFRDCFPGGRFSHRWKSYQVDARTCKKADRQQLQRWVDDYGEDSDFVRIRVRGLFPRASTEQFFSDALIQASCQREGLPYGGTVLGVDVARFGGDESVICVRQGAKVHEMVCRRELAITELDALVRRVAGFYQTKAIFVDDIGVGGGLTDLLQAYAGYRTIGVNVAERAGDELRYHNRKAELYSTVRDALKDFLAIPDDPELKAQLASIEYGYDLKDRLQIESKRDLKARGLASPDRLDALALTFDRPIGEEVHAVQRYEPVPAQGTDYDLYGVGRPW